jgi:phosphate transport system protein
MKKEYYKFDNMTLRKDEAINGIILDFESMANLVLQQLDLLEPIISSGNYLVPAETKTEIEKNEIKLDKMEVKLSEKIVNTIVLYQPVASDIRKIMACQRMVTSLERIGDYVLNITRELNNIESREIYEKLSDVLSTMFNASLNMVRKSLISFLNNDKELAIWTIKNDEEIGKLHQKMLKKAISKVPSEPNLPIILSSFITIKDIIQNIERIADHAANIAEAAIYSFEGKDVRHQKLED